MGVFDRINQNQGRSNRFSNGSSSNPYDIGSVENQINNAETRIRFSGYEPKEDKRNWFEKATNLPEGQNFFFDTLELLDRPGAGIRNTIDKKGDNSQEFWRGFSGKDKTRGTDILDDIGLGGVQNKYAKGVLGFGAEVLTDPTMLIPGGAIAKGVGRGAGAVGKVGKGVYNTLAPQALQEAADPVLKGVKDSLGYMFNTRYGRNKQFDESGRLVDGEDKLTGMIQGTKNKIDYQNTKNMDNIIKTAKNAGGYDKGDIVGRVMEYDLKQYDEAGNLIPRNKLPLDGFDIKTHTLSGKKIPKNETDKFIDNSVKEYRQQVQDQLDYMKNTMGQGVNSGGLIKDDLGNVVNRYGRTSNNAPWYQEFYRVNGRAPNQKEMLQLAKKMVLRGFDDTHGKIPGFKPKAIDELEEQISQLKEVYRADSSPHIKEAIDMMEDYTKKLEKQIAEKLADDVGIPLKKSYTVKRNVADSTITPTTEEAKRIQNAAADLMRGNQEIREQAKALGINIKEIQGYMRHILSKEERARRKRKGRSVYGVDQGNFGIGNPNDKFLQPRKYTGSAEEINKRAVNDETGDMGRKIFDPNAFFATAYGQKQLTEYMHAVDFRRKVLSDPSLAIKWQKGMSVEPGTVKINTKNYQFMKDEDLEAMGLLDEVGGEYIVPTSVKNALDQFQRLTTDEGIKGFLKGFDKAQSWWKRMALFSLPYHLRNDIGAKFNNYVGGMSAADIGKYAVQADKEVYQAMVLGKPSKMYDEYLQQGLGANSQSKVEFALRGDDAAQEIERLVKQQSQAGLKKYAGKVLRPFETSRQFGDFVDQTNRYAAYKWARDKGMNPQQAASKVRQTQFDYTDLTNFEREFMTRLVPFYRWMRNNLPYQIRQFANDPRKFVRVDDFRRNMQSSMGINEDNIPEWMTEQFAIPVTGNDDGSGKFVSMNLPIGDLTRVARPGKMMVDGLTPIGKVPIEYIMNRNFFYDRPIERYEGQQEMLNIPFTDRQVGIPKKPAYALENLTGQIGRNTFDYLQPPEAEDQDTKFRTPSLGISSMVKDYDVMKSEYYQKLNELQQLQDRIDWIEQQTGMRPPTMNQISQNRGRNRFAGMQTGGR